MSTEQAVTKGESSDLKKCPYCAENILKEAVVCKHCGKKRVRKTSAYIAAQVAVVVGVLAGLYGALMTPLYLLPAAPNPATAYISLFVVYALLSFIVVFFLSFFILAVLRR